MYMSINWDLTAYIPFLIFANSSILRNSTARSIVSPNSLEAIGLLPCSSNHCPTEQVCLSGLHLVIYSLSKILVRIIYILITFSKKENIEAGLSHGGSSPTVGHLYLPFREGSVVDPDFIDCAVEKSSCSTAGTTNC